MKKTTKTTKSAKSCETSCKNKDCSAPRKPTVLDKAAHKTDDAKLISDYLSLAINYDNRFFFGLLPKKINFNSSSTYQTPTVKDALDMIEDALGYSQKEALNIFKRFAA